MKKKRLHQTNTPLFEEYRQSIPDISNNQKYTKARKIKKNIKNQCVYRKRNAEKAATRAEELRRG